MTNKTIELDYNSNLDQKLISKIGNPFKFDNPAMQDIMNKFYNTNEVVVNKKILVIRMYDMAVKYAENNSVIYITDNKEKYDKFLELINNEKYGGNDDAWFIEDYRNLDVEIGDMKFDIIIGNPPYTRGGKDTRPLYIEILNLLIDKTDKLIWLCPSQWVLGYNIKGKIINNFKKEHEITNYTHISNPFNDAEMPNLVGIYYFDNNNINTSTISYDDIFYSQFSKPDLVKSIEEKFKKFSTHLCDYNNKENTYQFYVNASLIRGDVVRIGANAGSKTWNWTTLFGTEQRTVFNKKLKDRNIFWKFQTLNECKNFVAAHETDILEFAQLIEKSNPNICLGLTPYLVDYTHEWTEEEIAKELGLTDEEVDYIHEEMKPFGWKAQPQTRKKRKSKKDYFADMKD